MKRLTERNCNSGDYYMKCSKNCYNECAENIDCEDLYELIDRYGAIEEIIGDYSYIDRLRELVEADREGRCHIGRCVECEHYEGLAVCEFLGDCGGTNWICGWFEHKKV